MFEQIVFLLQFNITENRCTCSHAVFQCVSAVHKDLFKWLGLVGEFQVEALHSLKQLVRVMEVQHFGWPVEGLAHVVGEDLHEFQQELQGGLLSIFGGQ